MTLKEKLIKTRDGVDKYPRAASVLEKVDKIMARYLASVVLSNYESLKTDRSTENVEVVVDGKLLMSMRKTQDFFPEIHEYYRQHIEVCADIMLYSTYETFPQYVDIRFIDDLAIINIDVRRMVSDGHINKRFA